MGTLSLEIGGAMHRDMPATVAGVTAPDANWAATATTPPGAVDEFRPDPGRPAGIVIWAWAKDAGGNVLAPGTGTVLVEVQEIVDTPGGDICVGSSSITLNLNKAQVEVDMGFGRYAVAVYSMSTAPATTDSLEIWVKGR